MRFKFCSVRFAAVAATLLSAPSPSSASDDPSKIPAKIYTFWDGAAIPQSVERSISTWRRYNPEYEVTIISRATMAEFVSPDAMKFIYGPGRLFTEMGSCHLADLLRNELLAETGGVWLDASLALTQPLGAWLPSPEEETTALYAFDLDFALLRAKAVDLTQHENWTHLFRDGRLAVEVPAPARFLETWALAAPPRCKAMLAWRDSLRRWIQHPSGFPAGLVEAARDLESQGILHPDFAKWMPYLSFSFALWEVSRSPDADPELSIVSQPAEEWAFPHLDYMPAPWRFGPDVPSDYIADYGGSPMFALARASSAVPGPPRVGPLIKLRRFERCALDAIIAYRSYASSSPLVLIYELPQRPWLWSQSVGEAIAAFEAKKCGAPDPFLLALWAILHAIFPIVFYCLEHYFQAILFLAGMVYLGCRCCASPSARKVAREE